jgi:hypothetical protein
VGGRAVPFKLVVEAEKMRSEIGLEQTVGDLDRRDGLRVRRKRLPQSEHGEEALGRCRKRECARIRKPASISRRRFGIHKRDAETLRCLLGENQRKRSPGEPAAGNRDIVRPAVL